MASSKIKGITIEIGGDTTQLGKAISNVEQQSRSLQGELKQVEKLLKMDPGNVELIAQKQEILTRAVKETDEKLKILKSTQDQVEKQFKNGDIGEDQYRSFQREIIKTTSELDGFNEALKETDKQLEEAQKGAKGGGDGFTVMKGALGDLVSNVIQGAVSAIGDLVGSLFELTEATEEYRTMQAKLEGSSKTFGYSVDFANEKYKEFYKYLGDDQASTNAITNLMGIGTSTESVSKLAEGATAVWASYGDSIPIESLTESINETINAGKVTGTFADTINWAKDAQGQLGKALGGNKEAQTAFNEALEEGLPVEDAFNEALAKITDEQERADVVAQFLNSTYGESKTTYDELNKSVTEANEAELELKDTQAELGETMAPINTAMTDLKNKALEAITPLVQSLADAFMDLYKWLQENPVAMTILTAVVIGLATAFGVLATALAIQGIITGVTKAIAFLNTTLLANPIVLIVALIAGLVASFIYLWNNCEAFRQFWINLWEGIKSAFSAVVGWIQEIAPKIAQFFVDAWTAIKNCWSAVTSFFSNIWNGIKNIFSAVGTWFRTTFSNAWTGIKNIWTGVTSWFSGVWSGIKNIFSGVGSWFRNTFSNAWSAVKNVFSSWGSFFGGLWSTIKNKFSTIGTNIASAISGSVKSGLNGVLSAIERIINGGIGLINGAIRLINKIPGVKIGSIDKLSLPRLAQGGIVDSPTLAEIGEDGREAIIPLERNTGWINEIAKRLNGQLDSPGFNPNEITAKLDGIYERLGRLQMVTDTGALVGEMLDKIDAGLADKQLLGARGV